MASGSFRHVVPISPHHDRTNTEVTEMKSELSNTGDAQSDWYFSHHDMEDMDVGLKLGRSQIKVVPSNEVHTTLTNNLALNPTDHDGLVAFVKNRIDKQEDEKTVYTWSPTHVDPTLISRTVVVVWIDATAFGLGSDKAKAASDAAAIMTLIKDNTQNITAKAGAVVATARGTKSSRFLVVLDNVQCEDVLAALRSAESNYTWIAVQRHGISPTINDVTPSTTQRTRSLKLRKRRSMAQLLSEEKKDFCSEHLAAMTLDALKSEKDKKPSKLLSQDAKVKEDAADAAAAPLPSPVQVRGSGDPDLFIVHFNDVYHIQATRSKDPVGGADRFQTVLKSLAHKTPLVVFAGDAFSPSIMSTVTKGSHMIPVLNSMNINVAMFGNHDFDFGLETATVLGDQCNFPWLLSNVFDGKQTDKLLCNALATKLISWKGIKVGFMGLAEKEWIDTLPNLPEQGVHYEDYVDTAIKLEKQLRGEGAQLVIAISHMREPSDLRLAAAVPGIDIILSGHDHFYNVEHVKHKQDSEVGTVVVTSGCDFRTLSTIEVYLHQAGKPCAKSPDDAFKGLRANWVLDRIEVTKEVEPDKEMAELVESLAGEVNRTMDKAVGDVAVQFDATFATSRTSESNIGNLMTDIVRRVYDSDIALICGGAIRSNDKYGPGKFTLRDVLLIFPFEDPCMVVELLGKDVLDALENGVSSYPKLDGRFPHVSGMRFVYDPEAEPGSRITETYVGGVPLELNKKYSVATRQYMAQGHDGFDALARGKILVDDEQGSLLSTLLRNYFWRVGVLNRMYRRKRIQDKIDAAAKHLALDEEAKDSGYPIVVAPKVQGRILTVEQAKERDTVNISGLNKNVTNFASLEDAPRLLREETMTAMQKMAIEKLRKEENIDIQI